MEKSNGLSKPTFKTFAAAWLYPHMGGRVTDFLIFPGHFDIL